MLIPERAAEDLKKFDDMLGLLEKSIQENVIEPSATPTTPQARAAKQITVAYTLNALYFMFLKLHGSQPQNHPVKAELDRIKSYFGKLQGKVNTEDEEKEEKEEKVKEQRKGKQSKEGKGKKRKEKSTKSKSKKRKGTEGSIKPKRKRERR